MKKFKLISPTYRGIVNFEGFILNFDTEGKTTIEIEDNDIEKFENIINNYPNLYEGDSLPESINNTKVNIDKQLNSNSQEIEILKEANIKLAKENAELKKENENLKAQNDQIKAMLNLDEDKNLKNDIESELNAKTITELKSILKDIYGEFKEEWKDLTKKDEIVEYIKNKTIN